MIVKLEYIIFIGVAINVGLVTALCFESSDLTRLVEFAATISSIILSVLAIIITIVGEGKSENTKDKLLSLSDQLDETVKQIDTAVQGLNNSRDDFKNIIDNTIEIRSSVQEICAGLARGNDKGMNCINVDDTTVTIDNNCNGNG